jgi:hypothetical protein
MRYIVFLFVGLLFWGLVDDYVVCGQQLSPTASAADDDEYLHGQAKRMPHRLAEKDKTDLCLAVVPSNGRLTFAESSVVLSFPDLHAFACDSRLYVLMSLQI